ncbi:uncharacterized protein LOC108147076 [Drosophila elegans]|uniref:uncharacterized protein LOC108147076 n=1 Tax=Drosophila elegans TaxID=30023 RepID=UPI0007E813B2|nr:uncharacterized protein LOC108147076 [Drosophila elegans]
MGQFYLLLATWIILSPGRDCFINLLHHLSKELKFEYALLLGNSDTVWPELLWQLPVPIIQIDKPSEEDIDIGKNQSHNALTIAFVNETPKENLELLYLNLRILNTMPVLLVLKTRRINSLLEWCWHHQLLNVVAIDQDFEVSSIVYSYTPFPILQFIERPWDNSTEIFEARLENLRGYRVPFVLGGSSPRLIVYRDSTGELTFTGPVGNLIKCFEKRFNCRLVQPYPFNESAIPPARQLLGAVRNGSVHFALAAIYALKPFTGYSYPIELMSWCLMMPVPAEVAHSQLYSMVFRPSALWITLLAMVLISLTLSLALHLHGYRVCFSEFFLHDSCLRGVLSQPFCEVLRAPALVRGIYLGICVLGLLITSAYNSYFSTYVTSAPRLPPFTNYESIEQSNVKVVIWTPEYETLRSYSHIMDKYLSIFQLQPDYKEFLQLRDSFDTRYGYMMPLEKWSLVKEQQKVFNSPLFSLRDDLCVFHTVPIVFPIASNSIFREPLDRLILDVTESGLLLYWRDMALTEMIKADQLKLADRSKPTEFRAMKVGDLAQIWCMAGLMLGLATLFFILELICFWRLTMWQKIRGFFYRILII